MTHIPEFADKITHVNVIIKDQDKALDWYQRVLGAKVSMDQVFDWGGHQMRWLTVKLPCDDTEIVLMPPVPGPDGKMPEAGNGPMLILAVRNCARFVEQAKAQGVTDITDPEELPWGISSVLRDLDGNPFNVVQPVVVTEMV